MSGLDNVSSSEIFGIAPSLTAELGGDWRFKASGFFGTDRTGGYADLYLGGALARHSDKHFFNRNLALEASMEGPLAEHPAGALSVAFGAGVRRHDFFAVLPFNDIDRRRDNLFAYGELLVPLTSPAQAIDGLHRLSLTGALRFEDYSDAASIVTPKLGIIWEPVAILRVGALVQNADALSAIWRLLLGARARRAPRAMAPVIRPTRLFSSPRGPTVVLAPNAPKI